MNWEQFFESIDEIMKLPGTWKEKKALVIEELSSYPESETNFSEFLSWFGGELPN